MKQLIINGNPSQMFFSNTSTMDDIKNWVENDLNRFELSEEHSCSVSLHHTTVVISGDEDLIEIDVKIIQPINKLP